MKTYILLPKQTLNAIDTVQFAKTFRQNLERYFPPFELQIMSQGDKMAFSVVFMDDVKPVYRRENIISIVIDLFRKCFKDDSLTVNVKVNYGKLNPNYVPSCEKEDKKKENEVGPSSPEFDYEKLSLNYAASEPRYSFEQVILPNEVVEKIENAIGVLEVEWKVFDEWGLRSIIPECGTALNFFGPPGTGKSMAAEAVARKLGKKIIKATYADIESKYHGEGPKMVKAIFKAAEREDAVLFLDESDSLLSKRLTNTNEGTAQAINSMRSQLLISLENHKGLVVFATNLVVNYDKAFLSRLINIEFVNPSPEDREKIWNVHLKGANIHIPLANDVDIHCLAVTYDFVGREIKNAIKDACVRAAMRRQDSVSQGDFIYACERKAKDKETLASAADHTANGGVSIKPSQQKALKEAIEKKLAKSKEQ